MKLNGPTIWLKSDSDPETSFSWSLWVALHTQIYSYVHINDYIIRTNEINKIISFKNYFGFLNDETLYKRLSAVINKNLKKHKINEFKIHISEIDDIGRAITYMEKGRVLIFGVPFSGLNGFSNYTTVNNEIPENILYYNVSAMYNDNIYSVSSIDAIESKTGIGELYKMYPDAIKVNEIKEFIKYCQKYREHIKIIYVNVVTKSGEEIRSLNEY